MTDWADLTTDQLRLRVAAALGPWYWPAVADVERMLQHRDQDPQWSMIDALLNRERMAA